MKLNRRNTLIGLGTIVAGGGAALGTGAFSSVEAARSVDVSTEGDGSALLELEIVNETLAGEGGEDSDLIEFDVDDLNQDALTRFEDAFEIGYGGDEDHSYSLEIRVDNENGDSGTNLFGGDGEPMYFEGSDQLGAGEGNDEVTLDVVFDLQGENDEDDIPDEITIVAERTTGS
ncbi:hypothetical protein [Natronococcus sp.]|uniref:hypothetical protein n=1 Tax=Natronococcus sp. TaxID=35747 RepID=UPI0025D800C4|nr:hypothetical protein [Natronococcus sp.]